MGFKNAKTEKTDIRKWSIVSLGIALFLIVMIIPSLFSMIYFFSRISREIEKQAEIIADLSIDQLLKDTENTMKVVQNTAFYLMEDASVRKILSSSQQPSRQELVQIRNAMIRSIPYYTSFKQKYITAVFLFTSDGTPISTFRSGIFNKIDHRISNTYHQYKDFSSAKTLVGTTENANFSYFILDYVDISTMKPCGKIIIEIDSASLILEANSQTLFQDTSLILSDDQEYLMVYASDNAIPSAALMEKTKNSVTAPQKYLSIGQNEYFHTQKRIANFNLKIDIFIPKYQIFAVEIRTSLYYFLIALCGIVITSSLGFFVLKQFESKLKKTVQIIHGVKQGNLTLQIPPSRFSELDQLIDAFNAMTRSLDNLYEKAYTQGLLLRESEYKLLAAQINPHFIFNVLETINMKAIALQQKDISNMVIGLAELLRAHIGHNGKQKITIRQEFEYVNFYLALQKERFQNRLTYSIDFDDNGTLDYLISKLMIQPIVENSIVHGLENKMEGGHVNIRVWEEENHILIRVEDNGIGFDLNLLEQKRTASTNHIAVENIQRRISLAYGDQGKMQISSQIGAGTTILLVIPKEKEDCQC